MVSRKNDILEVNENSEMVVNISNVTLFSKEQDLLVRGLSFCPRPSQINHFQFEQNIQQFLGGYIKKYSYDQEGDSEEIHPFREKSKWMPPLE